MPSYSSATCSLITLPMADLVASGTMAAVLMNRYGPSAYPSLPLQTVSWNLAMQSTSRMSQLLHECDARLLVPVSSRA